MKHYCIFCNKPMKKPKTATSVLTSRENTSVIFICHRKECTDRFMARQTSIVGSNGLVVNYAAGKGVAEGWLDVDVVWEQHTVKEQEPDTGPLILNYN